MAILDQELREAIAAADYALVCLENCRKSLSKASGWGIFDMLGGGFIASLIKRGHLKDARREFENARSSIATLVDELDDVDEFVQIDFETSSFLDAMDIWFDNIFSDIMMQNKISEIRSQLDSCTAQIHTVRYRLVERLNRL